MKNQRRRTPPPYSDDGAYYAKLQMRKSGVRFSTAIAKAHNVTVSSLVFYVAVHTTRQHRSGLTGLKAARFEQYDRLAQALMVSVTQAKVALYKAKAEGLLDYTYDRRRRCLRLWLMPDAYPVYDEAETDSRERKWCRFHPRLAKLIKSRNASMLYLYLRYHGSTYRTPESLSRVFPHLSPKAVAHLLDRLVSAGLSRKKKGAKLKPLSLPDSAEIDRSEEQWMLEMKPSAQTVIHGAQYFCRRKLGQRPRKKPKKTASPKPAMPSPKPAVPSPKPHGASPKPAVVVTISGTIPVKPDQPEPDRIPSPPAAGDGRVIFDSLFREDKEAQDRMEKGWKKPKRDKQERKVSRTIPAASAGEQARTSPANRQEQEQQKESRSVSGYDQWNQEQIWKWKQEQAAISPDILRSTEARHQQEEQEVIASRQESHREQEQDYSGQVV